MSLVHCLLYVVPGNDFLSLKVNDLLQVADKTIIITATSKRLSFIGISCHGKPMYDKLHINYSFFFIVSVVC